jgi:EAL domain-containing protein (putative c-di-GMP-specific phosphodiesterase class I)/GGDEF domain-containing protein
MADDFQVAAEHAQTENVQEVDIGYSEQELIAKLQANGVEPQQLSRLKSNPSILQNAYQTAKVENNSYYNQLVDTIHGWPKFDGLSSFAANINRLIALWLNATHDGASPNAILNLLKSFELKSALGISSSSNFHCFLYQLVAETTQQHQQLRLDFAINFDANTKLPSTNQILPKLQEVVNKAQENQLIGLFSVQFEISKNNPIFSQTVANALNRTIAEILTENIPETFHVYFDGNLQFDILIPSLNNVAQLNLLAAKLERIFEQPVFFSNQSVLITPFVGCAYQNISSDQLTDLYGHSKLALESALTRKEQFVQYSEQLQQQLAQQNELEVRVLDAFANDRLSLFLQPIVDLKTSHCVGAELLLRCLDNQGKYIFPNVTIEVLNKVGKGKAFTRWLINSACRYSSELQSEHKLHVYLTLNLRAEDLYDTELPHLLTQSLALWKITTKDIVLEITEEGALEYNDASKSVISQLSQVGFRLALDDFGTGFSSLSRLRTMPIDLIKIDQSFVRDITNSKDDFEIVQSIAMLSKSLGKEVLAEGVEDAACLALIKKLQIDKCQGYFFAKPMPFDQFVAWVGQHETSIKT